ncbi:hypothetical protein M0R45_023907 [Rubus argutus]|uniref:Malate synthase C-terminal domain-containing protein n=1 Tax=Rubus argutus TaxID=59490 RepID=A0AAW1WPZ9_RUBAR
MATGAGSVPLYNLMEDAATAEISRVQNWQWIKYGVELDGDGLGVRVGKELFGRVAEKFDIGDNKLCLVLSGRLTGDFWSLCVATFDVNVSNEDGGFYHKDPLYNYMEFPGCFRPQG